MDALVNLAFGSPASQTRFDSKAETQREQREGAVKREEPEKTMEEAGGNGQKEGKEEAEDGEKTEDEEGETENKESRREEKDQM